MPEISAADDQPLPLLACDLDLLEPETIPWKVMGAIGTFVKPSRVIAPRVP